MATILALDVGTQTIGLALGGAGVITPLPAIGRKSVKKDAEALLPLCRRHGVDTLVVGLAFLADGTEGRSAKLARQVGESLAALAGLPVRYHDERYSTEEAASRLRARGVRAADLPRLIDSAAAAVILEDWLRDGAE